MRKIEQLLIELPVEANLQHEDADILYIGFISTKGAIQEGSNRLNQQGIKVNTIQLDNCIHSQQALFKMQLIKRRKSL